jgi:hypothetical protein
MKKKHLLIDEYPLLVLPSLAKTIGLNEAIALQQLHYWLDMPKVGVEMDGERWIYNTYEEWRKDNFPFWSVRTVERTFKNLERDGLVISMQTRTYDRKKYYRIHYDNLAAWTMTDCPPPDRQGGSIEDDKVAASLTETTTDITQENKDNLIETLQALSVSIFSNYQDWHKVKLRLQKNDISISGDKTQMIVKGLSEPFDRQFTVAQVWQEIYAPSFAKHGLELTFTE